MIDCTPCTTGGSCEGGLKSPLVTEDLPVAMPPVAPSGLRLAERLGLGRSSLAVSEPVRIEGSNTVRVDVVVWESTLASIAIRVLASNDA
ncbi:MAG: hypothetical protein HUU15_13535, partial [Candidatus Brocadiae bacterium]|nr:hypothetical protein [Candidatus Brocadiia bacterium]